MDSEGTQDYNGISGKIRRDGDIWKQGSCIGASETLIIPIESLRKQNMKLTGSQILIECLKEPGSRYRFRLSGRSNPECLR